jgi:hypothetical protein
VGNHVIGENCLTYECIKNEKDEKLDEYIAPNNFNYFYLDAAKGLKGNDDYNEIKII